MAQLRAVVRIALPFQLRQGAGVATLGCVPDNQVLCHMPLPSFVNYSLTRLTGRNLRRGNLLLAAYFYLVTVSRARVEGVLNLGTCFSLQLVSVRSSRYVSWNEEWSWVRINKVQDVQSSCTRGRSLQGSCDSPRCEISLNMLCVDSNFSTERV